MEQEKSSMNLLHHNEFGIIKQCSCCGEIHLAMGNILFHIEAHEFTAFKNGFDKHKEDMLAEYEYMCPNRKLILETKDDNLKLIVNKVELLQLFELLDMASIMIETQDILDQ